MDGRLGHPGRIDGPSERVSLTVVPTKLRLAARERSLGWSSSTTPPGTTSGCYRSDACGCGLAQRSAACPCNGHYWDPSVRGGLSLTAGSAVGFAIVLKTTVVNPLELDNFPQLISRVNGRFFRQVKLPNGTSQNEEGLQRENGALNENAQPKWNRPLSSADR